MGRIFKHLFRLAVLWFVLGMCYATLELLWRGMTYVQMIWVGGLAGVCIGLLNQRPSFCDKKMWQQCLLGTLMTLCIEFASGYLLNIRMHKHIWDYSHVPFNIMGQVCLPYAILWFALMPFAVYMDDWLRYKLFDETKPKGGPLDNYLLLFSGK